MSANIQIFALQRAVEIKPVATFFRKNLSRLGDGKFKIENLVAEQIYPKEDQFQIKYRLNFKNLTQVGRELILYGQIPNSYSDQDFITPSKASGDNILYHPDLKMLVSIFPYDSKLTTLSKAFSPAYMLKFFQENLPSQLTEKSEIVDCKIKVLGYRLEKRCTLLYELELKTKSRQSKIMQLIGKICSEKKSKEVRELLTKQGESQLFQKNKNFKIQSLILFSPELNALFLEYSPGKSLYHTKTLSSYLKTTQQISEFLNQLQESQINLEAQHTLADEQKIVDKSRIILSLFLPEAREKTDSIFEKIKDASQNLQNSILLPSHRDFYDKQVLIDNKKLTVIDWDTFAMADPALDFANFGAHLSLRAVQMPRFAPIFRKAEMAWEKNISTTKNKEFEENYKFYKLTALFRLASLYAFKPLWKNQGARLLELCDNQHLYKRS